MRELQCFQAVAPQPQDVLNLFNEQAAELGVTSEADIVSISTLPVGGPRAMIDTPDGSITARVEVIIFFWANN